MSTTAWCFDAMQGIDLIGQSPETDKLIAG